jgi:PAS domain S-box-containing protein
MSGMGDKVLNSTNGRENSQLLAKRRATERLLRRRLTTLVNPTAVLGDPFRLIADTNDDVIWTLDLRTGSVTYVNDAYRRVWNCSSADFYADPREWQRRIVPNERAAVERSYRDLLENGVRFEAVYRVQDGEGRRRWAHHKAWMASEDRGGPPLIIGSIRDVTDQKLAEEHQQLLLREMNHRVKNTLAIVVSIANQTAASAASVKDFMASFRSRVQAFSGAHDLMLQNVGTSAPLEAVIERTLAPYRRKGPARIHLGGPTILLPHEPSVALNMALHELATNAAKYGALSVADGTLSVTWSLDIGEAASILNLRWEESGGPRVREPSRKGFGSRLLKRTLATLGGEAMTHFAPSGFDCWISLPLPAPPAPASELVPG